MSELLELSYEVKLETPLHCGSGFARGILDRAVVRDGFGDLYIPGSTIKGRMRHAAEVLAQQLELHACLAPWPGDPAQKDQRGMCHGPSLCSVCLLFGAPSRGERLFFDDCKLVDDQRKTLFGQYVDTPQEGRRYFPRFQTWERTQVMLDRQRRVAATAHLFTSEFGVRHLTFVGHITGYLPDALPNTDVKPEAFLLAAMRLVESLGGDRSRGVGHCRLEPNQLVTIGARRDDWRSLLSTLKGA